MGRLTAAHAKQEEYKQGYHALRAVLKKAKEELEKRKQELATLRLVSKDMDAMKDIYINFKEQQKIKTKKVMERMSAASEGTCLMIHWQAWFQDMEDTKRAKQFQAELDGASGA